MQLPARRRNNSGPPPARGFEAMLTGLVDSPLNADLKSTLAEATAAYKQTLASVERVAGDGELDERLGPVGRARLGRAIEQLDHTLPIALFRSPDLAKKRERRFVRRIGCKRLLQKLDARLEILMARHPARTEAQRRVTAFGGVVDAG